MGRGTLQANWDPDVMADSINPCWLAEGNLCSFLGRWEEGRGWAGSGMLLDKSG